jgi:5-methylcytosine-specific restriction endonuclease McrA
VENYLRNPNCECLICRKPIYKRPGEVRKNNGRMFCSQACFGISCRKEVPCVVCGAPILASMNKKTCSRGCANRRRAGIRYRLNRPKDKVKTQRILKAQLLEARGQACERCKYGTYQILEVHHKDRNRDNNELTNLELICPNCHAKEHFLKKEQLGRV